MAALSSFTPEIALSAPGCADLVMENAVRNAAITFCNMTQIVTEQLDAETIVAGAEEVELYPASGTEVAAIISVYAAGLPIEPIGEQDLRRDCGDWKAETAATPKGYLTSASGIRLFPLPAADISVEALVAVRPTRTATTVPDLLLKEWHEAIVSGALASLLMIPKKDWTDLQLGAAHRVIFNDWMVAAQAKSFKQTNYAPLRVASA